MRLFLDIETSPNQVYLWRTGYRVDVPAANVIKEKQVICAAWKWEGGAVCSLDWGRKRCDRSLLRQLIHRINNAPEIVAHNGERFDVPWLRARCLYHGLVFPDVPVLDTCAQARRLFYLNSCSLDYLAHHLDCGAKGSPPFELWTQCTKGDQAALSEMITYCRNDVVVLQRVFERMRAYLAPKTHQGVAVGKSRKSCPICGSSKTKVNKRRVTAAGLPRVQLQCKTCGKYFSLPERVYENA